MVGPGFPHLEGTGVGVQKLRPGDGSKRQQKWKRVGLTSYLSVGLDHQATSQVAEGEKE